jgi:hypothetical protein
LQRLLHRRLKDQTGLQILAAAAADDEAWPRAVDLVVGGGQEEAVGTLRQLLRDHDGRGVAALATHLL